MNLVLPFQQAAAPSLGQGLMQMAPFLIVFFIFYWFVLLAPMRKQQKKTKEMLSGLKKGDRVVTSGGIHGRVSQVEDQVAWVSIADGVRVKVNKSAISTVLAEGEVAGKDPAP